ncbi:hypothetical protein B0H63DRAFT_523711 [Podospora didyma]|uniref:Uncharacterized protein n=1 Tax=Podospora didyma TaxID=330526 RepID=A0AAE0NG84_9PEZI|nr:hypothetical protein B0H63DRAFT_523711 [Podospora didyma]
MALSSPLLIHEAVLKPWEVSSLTTVAPSGRPGSLMTSYLNLTITDPNNHISKAVLIPPPEGSSPTTANCSAAWPVFGTPPYDQVLNCTETPVGSWTFAMLKSETPNDLWDFILRFTFARKGGATFVGSAHFYAQVNLQGTCSASGFCAFRLRDELKPFYINQTLVKSLY